MGPQRGVVAIVPAAGKGVRMRSDLPKVLHRAAGRTLLDHVLNALEPLELDRVVVVTSPGDEVERSLGGSRERTSFAVQDPPRGTADAVRVGLEHIGEPFPEVVLVAWGDGPLVRSQTFGRVLETHRGSSAAATILTARVADPFGYGRIVRDANGELERIVEEKDATDEERSITEVSTSVWVFDPSRLQQALGKIDAENAQGEYYLPDAIGVLRAEGDRLATVEADPEEVGGVNTRAQLAQVAAVLRRRIAERWMDRGVTIVDPETTFIDDTVQIGRDATILPFSFLEGETVVGEGAELGPQVRIVDSVLGEGAKASFAVVRGSQVGPGASVGPFASLRPGTRLERGARLGTFVESKNAVVGEDSKANHLSYLGDAEIGRGVNIGAGTITCNWDGQSKHKTVIEDDAYISSDTMLVAPVRVGKRGATGAGSVVRDDVPDDALAVGVPARIIDGKGDRMAAGASKRDADPEEPRQ